MSNYLLNRKTKKSASGTGATVKSDILQIAIGLQRNHDFRNLFRNSLSTSIIVTLFLEL